jgi:hypothetical protein
MIFCSALTVGMHIRRLRIIGVLVSAIQVCDRWTLMWVLRADTI